MRNSTAVFHGPSLAGAIVALAALVSGCGGEPEESSVEGQELTAVGAQAAAAPSVPAPAGPWRDRCLGSLFSIELPAPPLEQEPMSDGVALTRRWQAVFDAGAGDTVVYLVRAMSKPGSSPGTYEAAGFFSVLSRNREILFEEQTTFGGLDAVRYQFATGPDGRHRNTGLVLSQDSVLYMLAAVSLAGSEHVNRFLDSFRAGSCSGS